MAKKKLKGDVEAKFDQAMNREVFVSECPHCNSKNALYHMLETDRDQLCRHVWKASYDEFHYMDDRMLKDCPAERQVVKRFTLFAGRGFDEKH